MDSSDMESRIRRKPSYCLGGECGFITPKFAVRVQRVSDKSELLYLEVGND